MPDKPVPQAAAEVRKEAESAPVVKMINIILNQAVKIGASDIHLEPFEKTARIRFRIDGVLHAQKSPPKAVLRFILRILVFQAISDSYIKSVC